VSRIEFVAIIPNKITKPIPADIPNGMPDINNEINPPIKAYGKALAAIRVSFTVPKFM